MNEFYVYGLIDPRNNSLFYIGKGKGKRIFQHEKEKQGFKSNTEKLKIIKQIKDAGYEVGYIFICENLSEESALLLERLLIYRIGRKVFDEGSLINLVPGGKWNKDDSYFLKESDIPVMETIQLKFPELIPILEKYPHTAKEFLDINFFDNEAKRIYCFEKTGGGFIDQNIDFIVKVWGFEQTVDLINGLKMNSHPVFFRDRIWGKSKFLEISNITEIPYQDFDIIDFDFVKDVNDALLKNENVLLYGLYPDGNKRTEVEIDSTSKRITLTYYFPNGNKKHSTQYVQGNLHGKCSSWFQDGQLKEVVVYDDSNRRSHKIYFPNGQIEMSFLFNESDRSITTKHWFENGNLNRESISNGRERRTLLDSLREKHSEEYSGIKGEIGADLTVLGNCMIREYNERGILIFEKMEFYIGEQNNSSSQGYKKTYYDTGEIKTEIDYTKGQNDKIIKTYKKNGEVTIVNSLNELPKNNNLI